ncbi:hypothetical protein MHBO_003786, partial [Bonamia ostreae]
GFSNLMVLLLLSAKSSYKDIAIFSTTYYPYSLKLLWSPLVDSIFWKKIGRRRSWILPTQFVTAIAFIALGTPAHFFMRENQKSEFSLIEALINQNEIAILTSIFMLLFVCTSTQDIALDAWGLQLLPGEINHLVSTCQTAGLNLGNAIGYNAVILLTSDKFSSLTSFKPVTVGGFCLFVGFFAIFLNFWILFFVAESPYKNGLFERIYLFLQQRFVARTISLCCKLYAFLQQLKNRKRKRSFDKGGLLFHCNNDFE